MTWFKIDDNLSFHPKIVAAGLDAMGLWVRAGAWCAQQLTDGRVPARILPALADGRVELADRLVEVGLWERDGDTYKFHDWSDYNPSRSQIEQRRAARQAAGRAGGLASGASRRSKTPTNREAPTQASAEASASVVASTLSNPRPDPTRPDPTHTTPSASTRAPARRAAELAVETTAAAEAWANASGVRPSRRDMAAVQREIAELIEAGNPPAAVVEAARRAGEGGYGAGGIPVALRQLRAETRPGSRRGGRSDLGDRMRGWLEIPENDTAIDAEVVEFPRAIGGA